MHIARSPSNACATRLNEPNGVTERHPMTAAESLPPLDAGYYLATIDRAVYRTYRRDITGVWWLRESPQLNDPRLSGWTLTPVAAIEKLAEEVATLKEEIARLRGEHS